jgi:nitrite reductase (cytochrome c-552)
MRVPMKRKQLIAVVVALGWLSGLALLPSCSPPPKAEPVKTASIPDDAYLPDAWGKVYPLEYDAYMKTKDPKPPLSKYKKGYDTDLIIWDKLSEFPYMALLFNGWGFGVEYNEPRGHYYMLIDQLEIDPSRLKAGGVCLTCKSPYVPQLMQELGPNYFSEPYMDVHAKIPKEGQKLGVACINCHNNKDMSLKIHQPPLKKAMTELGEDVTKQGRQNMRSLVCAQCHVTYVIPKNAEMKSTDVFFPWQGSKVGDISIENIIKVIRSNPAYGEWKQAVTGYKVGYIRHPEYELYSRNSTHWNADVSCADCHMPYKRVGANKISDHNVTSPLKDEMRACQQCHTETPEWLKKQVLAIQDRTVSLMQRAGYATAVTAKLIEMAHKAQADGKLIDQDLYNKAKDLYIEAFYRVIFTGAENSVGFHNPTEVTRMLGDAIAMAGKSDALLRQALTKAGVAVPADVNLELAKYVNKRGVKPLNFQPKMEFADPFGNQDKLTPRASLGLEPVATPAQTKSEPPAKTDEKK